MHTDDNHKPIEGALSVAETCECGSTEFEMHNYSALWHEGDIHCAECGQFVRHFDAG